MKQAIHVLGGHGFIGSHLAQALAHKGHIVTSGNRPEHGSAPRHPDFFLRVLSDHDWLVHAASCSTPGSTAVNPMAEVEGNLRPLATLVEAMQSRPRSRLVYLSSAGTTYADAPTGRPAEADPQSPRSYHGAAKIAAEQFLRVLASASQCQVVVIRPTNIYGPGQFPRPGFGLVSTALARCLDGSPLSVFGDGTSKRDYLFIDDFVALVMSILATPYQTGFEVFNAAHGQGHTLLEVLEMAEKVTGRRLVREFKPIRHVDAQCIVPDAGKARERFGWRPHTSLADGMEKTWQWLRLTPG